MFNVTYSFRHCGLVFPFKINFFAGLRPRVTELSLVAVHRNLIEHASRLSAIRVLDKLTLCVYPMKQIEPSAAHITGMLRLFNCVLFFRTVEFVSLWKLMIFIVNTLKIKIKVNQYHR